MMWNRRRGTLVWRMAFPVLVILAASGLGTSLRAQRAKPAPREAQRLIVRIASYFPPNSDPEFGSGILLGADGRMLYVATARHVVRSGRAADSVLLTFPSHPGVSVRSIVSDSVRANTDVAVLAVGRHDLPPDFELPEFDRLGNPDDLGFGDGVSPLGCPLGVCWDVPVPADRVVGIDQEGIIFQSGFVNSGSSGGGLFNQWWEVVGMVTEDQPPRANAIRIDYVLELARTWGYAVSLKRAKVPRAGYRTHVGAMLLARTDADDDPLADEPGRLPSGRIIITRKGQSAFAWHASGLRLAPKNLTVHAAMAGASLGVRAGRFAAQPFVELGIGRVEGRYDAGGYTVAPGGDYVPFWNQQQRDGIGVGGGLSIQALVIPHVVVEVLGGHWSFSVPDSLSSLPTFMIGGGLRLGL